jgi:hypothetical protein
MHNGDGAVSYGQWTGVPLPLLLELAGKKPGSCEILFHGHDSYQRSLPMNKALHPDTLVAYKLNSEMIHFGMVFLCDLLFRVFMGCLPSSGSRKLKSLQSHLKGNTKLNISSDYYIGRFDSSIPS